jgi:hypothetical protein
MVVTGSTLGASEASAPRPRAEPFLLEPLVRAWASSTALLTLFEWSLLLQQYAASFSGARQAAQLLVLGFGNWLPYTLGALLVWQLVAAGESALTRRMASGRARLAASAALVLLALPYACWLARFTFSGPRARQLPQHALLVAGAAVLLALGFGVAGWLAGVRPAKKLHRLGWLLALSAAAFAALWLSRTVLVGEYEPLHAWLALWAVVFCTLAGAQLGHGRARPGRWLGRGGAALLVGASVLAGASLARSEDDSWILWSQTAASRYLTQRWSFLDEGLNEPGELRHFVIKPSLDTPQTLAWRKRRAEGRAPNIVIFSIDGLLPTRVGAYGYTARPTTPNIDRLARRGVRFTRAFSNYPATKNFNSSLLLGRMVPSHGAQHAPEAFRAQAITRLLDQRDYHVLVKAWFESTGRNKFDADYFKIDTNLPKAASRASLEEPMPSRMARVERHLSEAQAKKQPIFIWMHLLGTHPVGHQFVPDPRFAWGDARGERYDSAIAASDAWLPELERLMAAYADAERETIWVICADHGVRVDAESRDLYSNIVRVPLIIVGPGFEPRSLDEPVDVSLDLAATVVDLAGIAPPNAYDGISLIPLLVRGDVGSRMANRVIPLLRGTAWRGGVQGPFKLLSYKKSFSFFDSRSDPNEERNIYTSQKRLAKAIWKTANTEIDRRLAAFNQTGDEVATEQDDDD